MKRDGISPRNSSFDNDFHCKKVPQLNEAISQVRTKPASYVHYRFEAGGFPLWEFPARVNTEVHKFLDAL